jgi:hypothetical protein
MSKDIGEVVPPPGAGFVTETLITAAVANAFVGTSTTSDVEDCEPIGVKLVFPKLITDPVTKFVPVTVKSNSPNPTVTLVGEIEVSVGTGFVTASTTLFVTEPLSTTLTFIAPPVFSNRAGTIAASDPSALSVVGVSAVEFKRIVD